LPNADSTIGSPEADEVAVERGFAEVRHRRAD
jgi:hypothetical protein